MPRRGTQHTPEALERIREGTRRGLAAKERKRQHVKSIAGAHLDELRRTGRVHESLAPILLARRDMLADLAEDLGGDLPAAKRLLLDGVAKMMTAADKIYGDFLETGNSKQLEGLPGLISSIRQSLSALGLERVPRDVSDLETYLAKAEQRGHVKPATVDVAPTGGHDTEPDTVPGEPDAVYGTEGS